MLKGATLFQIWATVPHRATRDVDLLGMGESSPERLAEVMRAVCEGVVAEDGLVFDPAAVTADRIKEEQAYEGVRIACPVRLGNARLRVQIDVGFGDAVTPAPQLVNFPTILDSPKPVLKAYPRETVVAEKFEAMTSLGMRNSRMKDFFDLWVLARDYAFDGGTLTLAVSATFRRRGSMMPIEVPLALTNEFGTDATKIGQWEAFVRKGKLVNRPPALSEVISVLDRFLMPVSRAAATNTAFSESWLPGGPWRTNRS